MLPETDLYIDDKAGEANGRLGKIGQNVKMARQGTVSNRNRIRAVMGTAEAVIKVKYRGGQKGVGQLLDYLSRKGKLTLDVSDGTQLKTKDDKNQLVEAWSTTFRNAEKARDVMHLIVSTPIGSNRASAKKAAEQFVDAAFSENHDYVMVAHDDEKHPHAHIVVKMVGHDRTRLDPRKPDLRQWREQFAEKCRDNGIMVNATPRYVRAVAVKTVKSPVWHINKEEVSKVAKSAANDAVEIASGNTKPTKDKMPWVDKMNTRRKAEVQKWQILEQAARKRLKEAQEPEKRIEIKNLIIAIGNHIQLYNIQKTQRLLLVQAAKAIQTKKMQPEQQSKILARKLTQQKSSSRVVEQRKKPDVGFEL